MGKATDDLRKKHETVLFILDVLEKMCEMSPEQLEDKKSDQTSIIHFLKIFVDACHIRKEEDILFPAMEAAGILKEGGPIGVMLAEHNLGRKLISGMSAASESGSDSDFIAYATEYIQLMRSHIEKEDRILFMFADRRLGTQEQDLLLKKFEKHEETYIGESIHEAVHSMLERLGSQYLPKEAAVV